MRASLLALIISLFSTFGFSQVINTFPTSDSLETWPLCGTTCASVCAFPGGWSNQGNIPFLTDAGGTPTGLTGPSVDHAPGTALGRYVYVESSGCVDTAIIETPFIDLTNVVAPTFSFWYHQFGISLIDSFYIETSIDSGATWNFLQHGDSASNTSLDQWQFQFVDLNAFVGTMLKIRIAWRTGNSFHDFALDDFHFNAVQDQDAGVDSIYSSNGYCLGDTNELCMVLHNYGQIPIDSATITVTINGNPFNSPFTYYGPLQAGEDTTICFGDTLLAAGDVLEAFVSNVNDNTLDTTQSNDTATFTVSINPLPVVDAGVDTTVCGLDSVVLGGNPSGPPGSSYTWSPILFVNNFIIANPTAYYISQGTYSYELEVVDSNGCVNTDSLHVTVTPISTVDAGPDTTVCIGDSVVLGGSPAMDSSFSALWSPAQFVNDDTLFNPTAGIPSATSFILQGEDTLGCFFYDTVSISTFTNPLLNPGLSTAICLGDTFVLGGSPTATNFQTISWTPVATLSSGSVLNPTATPLDTTLYTVTLVDTFGCTFIDSLEITTIQAPVADAGIDTTVCAFDTFTVGGSPTGASGMSFNWSPGTLFNDSTLANPSLAVTQDTMLIVEVIDGTAGCSTFDTVMISIHPIPLADAGADQEICLNDSVALGGAPTGPVGASYFWTPSALLNDSSLANPQFIALDSAWVFLTVIDSINGCSNQDSVFVTVNPLPTVDAGPDQSICDGDSTALGTSPTSPTAVAFLWTPATGLDTATIANPSAFPSVTTTYQILVTDSNGCQALDSMTLTVDTIPVPVLSNPAPICFGDSAQLNASGGTNYFWSPVTGLDDPAISNPKASPPTTTLYSVNVIDGNGCSDTAQITLVVDTLPVVSAGLDQALCDGDIGMLQATGALTYQWSPTAFLTNPNSANTQAAPPFDFSYEVTGTDGNGCEASDSINLFVNFLPQVDAGPDVTVCLNDSVVVGGTPTGPPGATFVWSPGTYDDNTLANPNYIGTAVGTFTIEVELTDTNGCESTDALSVEVLGLPTAVIDPVGTTLCVGDSVELQASGGVSYQWPMLNSIDVNTSSPIVFPPSTETYTVTVTDNNGCTDTESVQVDVFQLTPADAGPDAGICQQGSITLTPSGGVSYEWSPANGLSSTSGSPVCTTLIPRTYTVTVTDANGCSETDQVSIDVYDLPVVNAGFDKELCLGSSVEIGGSPTGDTNFTFQWSPAVELNNSAAANPLASPTVNTTYRVTVTTDEGCQDSSSMFVTVNPLPQVNLLDSAAPICLGDTFFAAVTAGLSSYTWTPDDLVSRSEASNEASLFPTERTQFTATGTDANGCSSSVSFIIDVLPLPIIEADVFPEEICENDSVMLEVEGGVLFFWTDSLTINNTRLQNPWAFPAATRFYSVTGIDTNNCANVDSVEIIVHPRPFVDAGPDIENCDINVVSIGGDPTGPEDATYVWTPAAGLSDAQDPNPRVLDADRTTFTVEVQDANGCRSQDSVLVNADCYERIYAPTAFTPGDNDLNDEFLISNYRIMDTRLEIFDRNGQLIFETRDLSIGWDGSYRRGGGEAPSGVYYWKLVYRTDASRKRETEGMVTLIR